MTVSSGPSDLSVPSAVDPLNGPNPTRRTALGIGAVAGIGLLAGCSVYDDSTGAAAPVGAAESEDATVPEASADEGEPSSEPSADEVEPSTEPSADDADAGADVGGASEPALAATADIPVGGGKIFAEAGVVVTQPAKGTFVAFSTVCTHQGCAVNKIEKGKIICPCHDSRFAIADGAVTDGPARQPLPAKKVTVDGDNLRLA